MSLPIPSLELLKGSTAGKVVVVTGAAQGIGLAIAQLFSRAGARVVLTDVDEDAGQRAASQLGDSAMFLKCDVSSWEDQLSLFKKTISAHGRVDMFVCNAGVNPELMAQYDFLHDEYDDRNPDLLGRPSTKMFEVNIVGMVYSLKLAVHHMSRSGGGRVICIGSLGSYLAVPNQTLYCATKHAVLGLVRAASKRKDCLDYGIAISMVAPSFTDTRMTESIPESSRQGFAVSSPHDIANAVSILATKTIEWSAGKCICVQGASNTEVEEAVLGSHMNLFFPS